MIELRWHAAEATWRELQISTAGAGFEDRLLAKNQIRRALNLKDLENADAQRQPIIIQSAEGAQFIEGKLERVEEAYKRGMRTIQPVHEQDDLVSPVGEVYTAPAHLGGLTPFGVKVIKECNQLGMVIDMTHATWDTLKAGLKVATQPMLYSHAGLKQEGKQMTADLERRMLAKEEARAVADAGGVVGIWFRGANSVSDYVRLMKETADVVGTDHVGIGTDSDLTSLRERGRFHIRMGSGKTRAAGSSMRSRGRC
jgi:membrane dipeptidase